MGKAFSTTHFKEQASMRYILVDTLNLFFRARHAMHKNADLSEKLGMSMHTMLASANKVVKRSNVDHVVFCLEGGNNWRKDFYKPYKRQRAELRQRRTENEVEEDDLYFEYFNALLEYLDTHTNCSLIACPGTEADDVIVRFTKLHPDDEHVILSSDTDYYQLISKNVTQYNGISKETITIDGTFGDNNKPIIDKKTLLPKIIEDPEWLLFEKCIRGDKSDNIFSAFPGVRKKGTQKKVGMLEAFADRNKKGYNWNNLMLSRWVDHEGIEHKVIDDYERNKHLIDLTAQPQDIIDKIDETVIETLLTDVPVPAKTVGFQFMKFCSKYELIRLAEHPQDIISWLNKPYKGHITNLADLGAWKEWMKLKQSQ